MFGVAYYPTPKSLALKMCSLINWGSVYSVMDPSAGKGGLLDAAKETVGRARYLETLAIELDPVLQMALKAAGHRLIDKDWLLYGGKDRFDALLINPPFHEGSTHLLKAIEISAGYGAQIVCVLNAETIRNPNTRERLHLLDQLQRYSARIEFLEQQFVTPETERKTGVEVALISMVVAPDAGHRTDYTKDLKQEAWAEAVGDRSQGDVAPKDPIGILVRRFQVAQDNGLEIIRKYRRYESILSSALSLSANDDDRTPYIESKFLARLRRDYWDSVLNLSQAQKYLTTGTQKIIAHQIQEAGSLDVTERNIYALLEQIASNFSDSIAVTIEDVFDCLTTRFSYWSESKRNYYLYNSWKTNQPIKVGRKVILPVKFWCDIFNQFSRNPYGESMDMLDDIDKVMNYFSGVANTEEDGPTIREAVVQAIHQDSALRAIDTKHFTVNVYKKGTIHLQFKDNDALRRLNIWIGKRRQWLFREYGDMPFSAMNKEQRQEVAEFDGGEESYTVNDGPLCPALETPNAVAALCVA